jgi:hypothetical protein
LRLRLFVTIMQPTIPTDGIVFVGQGVEYNLKLDRMGENAFTCAREMRPVLSFKKPIISVGAV